MYIFIGKIDINQFAYNEFWKWVFQEFNTKILLRTFQKYC